MGNPDEKSTKEDHSENMKVLGMKGRMGVWIALTQLFICSCSETRNAQQIIQSTIDSIELIESVSFKQLTIRTNPHNRLDTITRFREMYFERLIEDSIVGVKGHWYMYADDRVNIIFEDIYDGSRVVRKNNSDSVAQVYDLTKYPKFRSQHFWGHNTPYSMQYEWKYMLDNIDSYQITRLRDTTISGNQYYQIYWKLEDKTTMPGFMTKLVENEGLISETILIIDKGNSYPYRMIAKSYMIDNPGQVMIFDQMYYDLVFNLEIDSELHFNTSIESLSGFEILEIKPKK